jgi:hypothetical protein
VLDGPLPHGARNDVVEIGPSSPDLLGQPVLPFRSSGFLSLCEHAQRHDDVVDELLVQFLDPPPGFAKLRNGVDQFLVLRVVQDAFAAKPERELIREYSLSQAPFNCRRK